MECAVLSCQGFSTVFSEKFTISSSVQTEDRRALQSLNMFADWCLSAHRIQSTNAIISRFLVSERTDVLCFSMRDSQNASNIRPIDPKYKKPQRLLANRGLDIIKSKFLHRTTHSFRSLAQSRLTWHCPITCIDHTTMKHIGFRIFDMCKCSLQEFVLTCVFRPKYLRRSHRTFHCPLKAHGTRATNIRQTVLREQTLAFCSQ